MVSPAGSLIARRVIAVGRLILAALILAAVVTQISDRISHGVFRPAEYFSYFTVETALIFVVIFAVGGVIALRTAHDTRLFTIVRMCAVPFTIVTFVIYNTMLRGLPPAAADAGYVWPIWPNELLHVWAPIFIVLDWVFAPGRYPLRLRALWWVLVFPLAWVTFSLIRGVITGWWPYPFLDPTGPLGWAGVVGYIAGIAAAFALLALLATSLCRLTARRRALATPRP